MYANHLLQGDFSPCKEGKYHAAAGYARFV
jgi:hypothetical protein